MGYRVLGTWAWVLGLRSMASVGFSPDDLPCIFSAQLPKGLTGVGSQIGSMGSAGGTPWAPLGSVAVSFWGLGFQGPKLLGLLESPRVAKVPGKCTSPSVTKRVSTEPTSSAELTNRPPAN